MISLNINEYDIEIKRHAFIRAIERGIIPDIIEATIKSGKVQRFGKNNIKFKKGTKILKLFVLMKL